MRLLNVFWERQRDGRTLHANEVRRVMHDSGITHWDEFRNLLQDCHLIRRTEEGGYVLIRDLRALTMAELLTLVPWPAEQQLRIHANGKESWEATLKTRCDQARDGLRQPLDFNLEALFGNRLDESRDVKEEEIRDNR
jgi:membrane protein